MKPAFLIVSLLFTACGDDPVSTDQPDAARSSVDGATTASCGNGGARFALSGPLAFEATSFNTVTVSNKIAGVAGSVQTGANVDLVTFGVRSILASNLESLGDHDVATMNLMAMRQPLNATCTSTTTTCNGFYAEAGTLTVLEISPRFRATFTLTNLLERHDAGTPGPAMPGTIVGCIDTPNP